MALAILGYTTPWLTNIGNKHLVGQSIILVHTTYSWNIKWQKCAGISGLWDLNEIILKNPGNMEKIVGAIWKLPAK